MVSIKTGKWKRYFSVPCALIDDYIKLADAAALKVILYLLSSEADNNSENDIISATGITPSELNNAIAFWQGHGIIESDNVSTSQAVILNDVIVNKPVTKITHSHLSPADIAKMLSDDVSMKHLFDEAEVTLGRMLKHADHETVISLKDYYGFSPMSIITILAYCADLGKTSAKYIEGVAKGLFDKGITDFNDIEKEFERLKDIHSFENKIKVAFGLESKLTPKQKGYIESWKSAGLDVEIIAYACEKCIDATNKVAFPYIDKILTSWVSKNIMTVEDAKNENTAVSNQRIEKTSSFDIDDFDKFTLGISDNK